MDNQATITMADLKKQRRELAHRKRRIIFNNDGDDLAMLGKGAMKDPLVTKQRKEFPVTDEGLLAVRTTALLGSQVDTIFYYSSWGMNLHHQDGPFGKLYGCPDTTKSTENHHKILAETGKDSLEVMIDVCRNNGMEMFYSSRMNDTHDSFAPNAMHRYNIRRAHPEWSVLTEKEVKKGGWANYPHPGSCWTAWNFEVPEIRRLTVDALREVCRNYHIDGIELDWWRWSMYFKEHLDLKPATQEHVDLMNDLMREIRRMTEEEGLRRGKAILIASRCAEDIALTRSVGLDVQTWLEEDLVDILTPSKFLDFTMPMKELIDLAHRYHVPVYPMVHAKALADGFDNKPIWRGEALVRYSEGADGAYTFNVFDPDLWLWWELGDPNIMAGKDTTYIWDYLPSQRAVSDVHHRIRTEHPRTCRPVRVTEEGCEAMPLYVGEDLSAAGQSGKERRLTLRVRVKGLQEDSMLTVTVNGQVLPEPQATEADADDKAGILLKFEVNIGLFKMGENAIGAVLAKAPPSTVQIDDVQLFVRYA